MGVEGVVAGTQVVQPGLAVAGGGAPVLGAAPVAGPPDRALDALARQRGALGPTELALESRGEHGPEVIGRHVAQPVAGLDVVVAGVHVAVVLHRQGIPALGSVHAQAVLPEQRPQRDVEILHEHATDVAGDPLVEDGGEEPAVLLGGHRPAGHPAARLPVEHEGTLGVAPPRLGDHLLPRLDALHDGDELDELGPQVVAEVPVHHQGMVGVDGVDRAQHVGVDPVLLQHPQAAHDLVVGAAAGLVHPVVVVEFARAVDADADQELLPGQERTPRVVQQGAVGLDRVLHLLSRPLEPLGQGHGVLEERQATQGGFTALPADRHRAVGLGVQEVGQPRAQRVVGHGLRLGLPQHLLGQEEAVGAVEVARRPGRLGDQREGTPRPTPGAHPATDTRATGKDASFTGGPPGVMSWPDPRRRGAWCTGSSMRLCRSSGSVSRS